MPPGLYVHVPFCLSRCHYCDFYRIDYRPERARAFLEALGREIAALPDGFRPETIYVGGGTPSALQHQELAALLERLRPLLRAGQEFTLELNPGSTTPEKMDLLREHGVTRVSLGVQSFRDSTLEILGRRHRRLDALEAFELARRWISSVGLDLIGAVPGTTVEEWNLELSQALALCPDHLSVYSLTYEEGTRLAERARLGELSPVSEEMERALLLETVEVLTSGGYEHYEISNYCRPGHRSRHNEGYWNQGDYIGVGPGAWSTLGGMRYVNLPDLDGYVTGLERSGVPPRRVEYLSATDRSNEHILLGLRTRAGLSLEEFRQRSGMDLREYAPGKLEELLVAGLVELDGDRLALTLDGLCIADWVILKLLR